MPESNRAIANTLYEYPPQSEFNRIVSKEKIYQYAKPSSAIKERFVEQVERIKWQYKLSPETINLPAKQDIKEIQVFTIHLKVKDIHDSVLHTIDKAINFPLIFQLIYNERIKTTMAYKRPSESDKQQWVIYRYFESDWLPIETEHTALPVALNLASLYEQIMRQQLPIKARSDETLHQQLERLNKITTLEKEAGKIQSRLNKEKQFNRKVELNRQLKQLQEKIESLNG